MKNEYLTFLENKKHSIGNFGFDAKYIPDIAFDFQKYIIEKAVKKGRIAIFADTWLGKTFILLSIAKNVVEHTNNKVLILTPLSGVGSEVYSPLSHGRKAIGIELKDSYYKQMVLNVKDAEKRFKEKQVVNTLFDAI